MGEVTLNEMVSPDNTVIVDGPTAHFLAIKALKYTGREPRLAEKLSEILITFGVTPDTDSADTEELQTCETDPLKAQRQRGAVHDSLFAYVCSDQIPEEDKSAARAVIQSIRCQSAINN